MIRIALSQIDPVVGAFEDNAGKILRDYERACAEQARLLLTTELAICGYPPHDLVDRPEMFERNERVLEALKAATRGKRCALAVGHIARNPSPTGRAAQNVVSILENGKLAFRQAKMLLPTYDVFDEARYFEPAHEVSPWVCDGIRIGVAICEDLWAEDPQFGRRLYGENPERFYREQKVDLLVSLSSSPFTLGKRRHREELHAAIARRLGAPLVYVNQMGATDEILFDGGSFALSSGGELIGRLPLFRTSFGVLEVDPRAGSGRFLDSPRDEREDDPPAEIEILLRALVTGIREYFHRTGFKSAILGLSGGIDSALVAALASRALGPTNVLGVAMPSRYSSSHSLEDAEILARNLGIGFEVRPIKFLFPTISREIADRRGTLAPLALENLQSRLRGTILMTLSNHYRALVLTTGNKSELAMGYCTLYGDMDGAIGPIGDLFKTQVYELSRYVNQVWGDPIPERVLTKAPSAELRPNQKDQDTLPPYEILDQLLEEYVEKGTPVEELEERFGSSLGYGSRTRKSKRSRTEVSARRGKTSGKGDRIRDILRTLEINEFKRRQAAPVLKVSPKAFGIGRRVPLAKIWDQGHG